MRKFFAFTVIFATWYFAGMNAQSAILASVISLLIILLMSRSKKGLFSKTGKTP